MEHSREEKEIREFSWSTLFVVTGCCFLLFAGVMKMIEGSVQPIFLRIGIACLLLWTISILFRWQSRRNTRRTADVNNDESY